jgi:hypothetical protein
VAGEVYGGAGDLVEGVDAACGPTQDVSAFEQCDQRGGEAGRCCGIEACHGLPNIGLPTLEARAAPAPAV